MINIPIFIGKKEHRIQSDSRNYMLCEYKRCSVKNQEKRGKEGDWHGFMFYSSLPQMMTAIYNLKLRACDAKTINELIVASKRAQEEVYGLWENPEFYAEKDCVKTLDKYK